MADKKHVYLKNPTSSNDGFKKKRGFKPKEVEPEEETLKYPKEAHQRRLRSATASFYTERKTRQENKTLQVPAHIDLIKIHFYKTFDESLQKAFYSRYGLTVCSFEDFNKTVLLSVDNTALFKVFIEHLQAFYTSKPNSTYEGKPYNLIALIHDFKFLSTRLRIYNASKNISSFGLIPIQTQAAKTIYDSLIKYISGKEKDVVYSSLTNEIIDVKKINEEEILELVDNFDIIKTVTSSRTERIRPGKVGEQRRDYGFTTIVNDDIPTVAIIDTGINKIDPLNPLFTGINYNLTDFPEHFDESGHGTSVAGLVVFGEEFITVVKASYEAKAKLAIIKAIHFDDDEIDIVKLTENIKDAKRSHNIRLFNLSLNEPAAKPYNSAFSDYAYLLDKLAYEEDILIFISVGNITEVRLNELINDEPHPSHEYPFLFSCVGNDSDIHSCRTTNISSPSESLNNISIGALAGNLEPGATTHITPAGQLPAYYTRKFHYDYDQQINGTDFKASQRNKHLNKPDLIFEGGDLFDFSSGIETLTSPIGGASPYYSRNCGTSLSTPLVTSLAAEILTLYPKLNTQTVKSILINSARSVWGTNPIEFRSFSKKLLQKLTGFGRPLKEGLFSNNDNTITFIIEDEIELEEVKSMIINIPDFIKEKKNKLQFDITLCYSFLPSQGDHLNYLPLQITFGVFKPVPTANIANNETSSYKLKSAVSWSDDFFGVNDRLFSNSQYSSFSLDSELLDKNNYKVSLAVKCTGKNEIPKDVAKYLEETKHKFSICLTITELPLARVSGLLYDEITEINNIESIIEIEGDAIAET